MRPGRTYDVTVQLRIEPGPHFEDKVVKVRAYDALDALLCAPLNLNDPRFDRVVRIEPSADDLDRILFDFKRLLGAEAPVTAQEIPRPIEESK